MARIEAGLTTVAFTLYFMFPLRTNDPRGSPANASKPVVQLAVLLQQTLSSLLHRPRNEQTFFYLPVLLPLPSSMNDICDMRDSCRLESETSTRPTPEDAKALTFVSPASLNLIRRVAPVPHLLSMSHLISPSYHICFCLIDLQAKSV